MQDILQKFFKTEDGAVTVDWIVLTAVLVGLCFLLLGTMHTSSVTMLDDMGAGLIARFGSS